MSTVEGGVIKQLSVTQIETFDVTQEGGCPRKWWFERAVDLCAEQSKGQAEGEAGHAHLAHYFLTGELPKGRKLMGKAATGAIVKGKLPERGDDLFVELRFDGQEKYDAAGNWIPLDVANTLTLAGVPLDGFIDLTYRRGPIPVVLDHKFFTPCRPEISDNPYAWLKTGPQLIRTVQMPVYALSQRPYWPDATHWRLAHHYVSKKGVDSLIRSALFTTEQILERGREIESVIERMKVAARAERQNDVPANPGRACDAWQGCPHQSICSAHKTKGTTVQLSPEEAALFDDMDLPETGTSAPDAAPTPPVPAPVAAAPAPVKVRRMAIIDVPAPSAEPVAAPVEASPSCACGVAITPENGSKLQSGSWVHVNCPLTAPPPAPAKERKPRAPKPVPVTEKGHQSPDGTWDMTIAPAPAPAMTMTPAPLAPTTILAPTPAPAPEPSVMGSLANVVGTRGALEVAGVLESIAKLLRAAV